MCAPVLLVGALGASLGQDGQSLPIDVDQVEEVTVRLVLVDVLVLDRDERTVPDLSAADFEILYGGEILAVDTLDVDCPAGRADDPRGVRHASQRPEPVAPDAGRKIVLALDYLHLNQGQRVEVLDRASEMVRHGGATGEEIMVVALNGGLRVEQQFSSDRDQVQQSLRRMQYDISLWQPDYVHLNEYGFVDGMTAMLDVLGTVEGNKAVVLFSAMQDVPLDLQFQSLAAHAAASRCSIYPVEVGGLRTRSMFDGPAAAPG